METVVQDLNTETIGWFFARQEKPATLERPVVIKKDNGRLPQTIASTIVKQAWAGKRLSRNALLYGILAHHYAKDCRKIETIRGLIEHAEADYPEMDRRRRTRSSS
jgi:hypothetical protein